MDIEPIKKMFPDAQVVTPERGDGWMSVPLEQIVELCKFLRDNFKFDCLTCLTGTDRKEYFEVVYHLFSYANKETIVLKVKLPRENPIVSSVSEIWPSANWMEREAYDLLGINFVGHPDLRRIMLPEDWPGHPLRKDYVESEEYAGMTTVR